ncbi:SET domain-containing protein [Fusarium falciforme]|uniref:SET domain-containing protein n=1 Tax=Fusarium falciforme TaxID=195108 RepID=UPI002300BC01|nr:SET domain-containing protein [Fusarium falciforme]WAO89507.1 SET domain-containing protein [Fusarium falciforme]
MASSPPLSITSFPAWARLNDVDFTNAELRETDVKGIGLVAARDLKTTTTTTAQPTKETTSNANGKGEGLSTRDGKDGERARTETAIGGQDEGKDTDHDPVQLLRIPHDLVLSAAAIEEYTKVDQNFRQLLDVAGHQSTRKDILLYLLTHLILSHKGPSGSRGPASTPWTEYLKFLPRHVPVPTMWSEVERALLQGTSLEAALEAKLAALNSEFDELREKSSGLAFWNSLFWEKETATIQDWILIDALYRSRCLELPRAGDAMVPGLDMANHSHNPTAYYEEDDKDDIVLLLRPGVEVTGGEEVSISYGEKSPAEMLFSYGFIDRDSAVHDLTLPLEALPDDPLGKAKLHIFKAPPTLKLSRSDGRLTWRSPFAYLMCLNEEDGLEFRVLQGKDGERELKLFWQDQDVTARADDFEVLIEQHPLCQVFRLRVVTVLHEMVSTQLTHLPSEISHDQLDPLRRAGLVREECIRAAETLWEIEASVLESATEALEQQRTHLFADDHVVAYLGSMEVSESGQAPDAPANEEDDFS